METLTAGSLFTGYGGLDRAVEAVFGARTIWHAEYEPPTPKNPRPTQAAAKLLAYRFPDVPNLGDIAAVDWSTVPRVDVLGGGFPCQDVSNSGKRLGMMPGSRSGMWTWMAYAIDQIRPRYVVIENVRGLLNAEAHSDVEPCTWCLGDSDAEPPLRALGAVLGDLADVGYDARWCGLQAADVGAPHGRFRVFIIAADTRGVSGDPWRIAASGETAVGWPRGEPAGRDRTPVAPDPENERGERGLPARTVTEQGQPGDQGVEVVAADSEDDRREWNPDQPEGTGALLIGPDSDRCAAADSTGNGRYEGWPEPAGQLGGPDVAQRRAATADTDRDGLARVGREQPIGRDTDRRRGPDIAWGAYEPAIRRWEHILERPAPGPTEPGLKGGPRLAPRFVEWMMGLPAGWVTDVPGITRNDQLRMLGNGVVPLQAEAALRFLLNIPNS